MDPDTAKPTLPRQVCSGSNSLLSSGTHEGSIQSITTPTGTIRAGKATPQPSSTGVQCCALLVFTSLLPAEQSPCCKHNLQNAPKTSGQIPNSSKDHSPSCSGAFPTGAEIPERGLVSTSCTYLVSSQLIFNTQAKTEHLMLLVVEKARHSLVTRQLLSYKGLTHSDGKWTAFSSTPRNNSKGPESSFEPSGCKWTPIKERECAALLSHLQGLLP